MFLETDPSARTSSLPPTGGRGVGKASSLTGGGGGWVVSTAAGAMSRFPGPPLEDPPHKSPSQFDGGAVGGARWADRRCGLPSVSRARSSAAAVTGPLAHRLRCRRPPHPEVRRHRDRRDRPRSGGRGGRAGPITSAHSAARRRAWRVTGVAIWPALHRAEQRAATCKPVSSPSGLVHAQREGIVSAIPGHGNGPLSSGRRHGRPD